MTNPEQARECVERVALLPCPFCGERAEMIQMSGGKSPRVGIRCSDRLCGAANRLGFSEVEAVSLWNARTAAITAMQPAIDAAVKAERERAAQIAEEFYAKPLSQPIADLIRKVPT